MSTFVSDVHGGYSCFRHVGRCYSFHHGPANKAEAVNQCSLEDALLLSLETVEELDSITKWITDTDVEISPAGILNLLHKIVNHVALYIVNRPTIHT